VIDNCLIAKASGILIRGTSNSGIPQNGEVRSLGTHCFSSTGIQSIQIPEGIKIITNNAFSRCTLLTKVELPSTTTVLDATCFAWCTNLSEVNLPEGLTTINTYVFDSCALEEVVIPASVTSIANHAFGNLKNLKKVTFKKQLDENGKIIVPKITSEAFINSGSSENPVVFNLPWSLDKTLDAPWGASNCVLNFNYEEEA
jgi:hypothetical protein